jgi:diguanylate cyclase (GGDEF)-like protein/PAS domain S-box-containing protein
MTKFAHLATVFDGAAFGIALIRHDGSLLDSNEAYRAMYGASSATLLREHETEFAELVNGKRDLLEFERRATTASGQEMWTSCTFSRMNEEDGKPSGAICMIRDMTSVRENERRMLHDMTHDPLTGMPNRLLFESKLREQIAAQNARPAALAVLILDIDHFREINEGFGYDSGEFVVSEVGKRLSSAIGPADVVARTGTDQFAILARSQDNPAYVESVARRLFSVLAKPFEIGQRTVYVSASVGIAAVNASYQRAKDVMRDAQIATRYAKSSGGSRTAVFDEKMTQRAQQQLQLSNDMRAGLERGEFFLLYQPIVTLDDGEFRGCEALLRWNHPSMGLLQPSEFVPLAEQVGMSTQMGRVVARLACRQLAAWRDESGLDVRMNVNVAWPDLLEAEFEQSLIAVTREFGIKPPQITLEITENIVLNPGSRATLFVERLRQLGFGICIDDFGTGYSSLHYLQRFKIDALKIDRSFVAGPQGEIESEPIIRALMTLANGFGVRVVAEGVETKRQRDVLSAAGCRYGQGFFFSKPLSADELVQKYPRAFAAQKTPT